ncbi:hypothetical protein HMPREF3214_01655 [Alloscardovia omnicolens]|nr:hypothetical protein HMPREF3214_01655 [Alloscardovia omnicolens]
MWLCYVVWCYGIIPMFSSAFSLIVICCVFIVDYYSAKTSIGSEAHMHMKFLWMEQYNSLLEQKLRGDYYLFYRRR